MSRLTDEELDEIDRTRFPTHMGEPPASVLVRRMMSELRERRAADLTSAHIDGLRFCVDNVWDDAEKCHPEFVKLAREALDKLLAREVGR